MTDRLHSQIAARLLADGWQVSDAGDRLHAYREAILARWWFGSRRLSLQLDAASMRPPARCSIVK